MWSNIISFSLGYALKGNEKVVLDTAFDLLERGIEYASSIPIGSFLEGASRIGGELYDSIASPD